METNKIDKIVRDSLQSRIIEPSNSAWERLSDQLDVVAQPKRMNWFKYVGYAASVLLLITVAFFINTINDIDSIQKNDVVTIPAIDTTGFLKKSFKNTVPVETVIVKTEALILKRKKHKKKSLQNIVAAKQATELKVPNVVKENSKIVIAENKMKELQKTKQITNTRIKIDSNALLLAVTKNKKEEEKLLRIKITAASNKLLKPSRIYVNSDALLYAVSNPNKDISEYYKKYNVDRNEVLKNIQKKMNKVNLRIDAATLLTDIEKSIDEETFKNSFMQVVKGKIVGLASAFSNRNN